MNLKEMGQEYAAALKINQESIMAGLPFTPVSIPKEEQEEVAFKFKSRLGSVDRYEVKKLKEIFSISEGAFWSFYSKTGILSFYK